MAYSVIASRPEEHEFEQAVAYIAVILSAPQAATDLADRYEKALNTLEENPLLYPVDPGQSSIVGREVRKCVIKGYVLYYTVQEREVWLLAFLHERQDAVSVMANRSW